MTTFTSKCFVVTMQLKGFAATICNQEKKLNSIWASTIFPPFFVATGRLPFNFYSSVAELLSSLTKDLLDWLWPRRLASAGNESDNK